MFDREPLVKTTFEIQFQIPFILHRVTMSARSWMRGQHKKIRPSWSPGETVRLTEDDLRFLLISFKSAKQRRRYLDIIPDSVKEGIR